MDSVEILEMESGEKYAIIDSLNHDGKEYILIAETEDEKSISEELDIMVRNSETNTINQIEDELEYDLIKEVFERKLGLEEN